MKIIEITEHKVDKLSSHLEDALSALGKAMHCVEELGDEAYNERRKRGYRDEDDIYGERRGGMRYKDEDEMWAERRRRR